MAGVKKRSGGKRANAGRKSKAEELGLRALLDQCWTPAERKACIKKLAQDAKSSDFKERHAARQLLLSYAFGKPKESQDSLDYSPDDLRVLNDYELELFIAGHDPRPLFAAASRRAAREKSQESAAQE